MISLQRPRGLGTKPALDAKVNRVLGLPEAVEAGVTEG
jgi:hypothetical protein